MPVTPKSPKTFAIDAGAEVKARDAWSTVVLFDPLAIPFARYLAARHVNAATVTSASLLLGLISACFGALGRGPIAASAVLLAYYASFMLDCVDGKLARLSSTASPQGAAFDLVTDAWKTLAYSFVLILRAALSGSTLRLIWVLLAVLGLDLSKVIGLIIDGRSNPSMPKDSEFERFRPRILPKRFANAPSTVDVEVLLLGVWLPLVVAGRYSGPVLATAVGFVMFRVGLQIRATFRLWKSARNAAVRQGGGHPALDEAG